jgi:hypothetical protein
VALDSHGTTQNSLGPEENMGKGPMHLPGRQVHGLDYRPYLPLACPHSVKHARHTPTGLAARQASSPGDIRDRKA